MRRRRLDPKSSGYEMSKAYQGGGPCQRCGLTQAQVWAEDARREECQKAEGEAVAEAIWTFCCLCGGTIRREHKGSANGSAQTEMDVRTDSEEPTMSALPATINLEPLQSQFDAERRDFDRMLGELKEIDPQAITADLLSKSAADFAADCDTKAKTFIVAFDAKVKPILDSANDVVRQIRNFRNETVLAPDAVRSQAARILSAHQFALNFRAESERRELERQQREQAEHNRQAEVADLQERAAHAADPVDAASLKEEAAELKAAPLTPIMVPTASVAQPKPDGITGTAVYVREVEKPATFLTWLAGQPISSEAATGKRNLYILRLAGIEITVNFAGLRSRSEKLAIPGVKVSKTFDTRNRRTA